MRIFIIERLSRACQSRKTELDTWFQIQAIHEAVNACEALHLSKNLSRISSSQMYICLTSVG
jgi:hypothetical protein